ncbi:MAG: adenylate/guanylate cyclase domain-containing protein [Reyranellaceae bacterium]
MSGPVEQRPMPAKRRPRISLRVSLVVISLLTVALTAAAVHFPWFWVSRDNVAEMSRQLTTEIVSGVDREVDAIFTSAIAAQSTVLDALEAGVIDIEDKAARDRLFLAFLKANPHFSWVSFGKPNGDFYGAQRRDEIDIRVADSTWDSAQNLARRVEDYYVNDGERLVKTITKVKTNDYYSPDRAWFKLATAAPDKHIWTDVYVFDTSRKPGVNSAIAFSRNGELVGVVSIAIELERISNYLRNLKTLRSGTAFIVNRTGNLVAFPDASEVTDRRETSSNRALRPLAGSYHPMLQVAQAAIRASSVGLQSFETTTQLAHQDASGRYLVTITPAASRTDWIIGTVIPEADFMGRIEDNYLRLALAVLVAVLLVSLLAVAVSRHLFVAPMQQIIGQTRKIEQFDLASVRRVESPIREIDALSDSVQQMSKGLGSFRRYLPAELVQTLMAQGVVAEPGGERRTMSVLFMDLEGFTAMSERMGHRVVPVLGEYLGAMSDTLMAQKATIDKFIGDAIMAFWGAPHHNEEHATDACRAALDCQRRFAELQAEWARRGLPAMRMRIGLNTGRMVVGNIGSAERLNYTVIGDSVNLASRMEALNNSYGTNVLISHNTFELAKYDIVARRLDAVSVRGKEEAVPIYELLAMRDESGQAAGYEWIAMFDKAMAAYGAGRWHEATRLFDAVIELRGEDAPSRAFIERCGQKLAAEPKHPVLAASRAPGASESS